MRAQSTATVGVDGYYRCTVTLDGAADSPKSIQIPVHVVPKPQPPIGTCELHYSGSHEVGVEETCWATTDVHPK